MIGDAPLHRWKDVLPEQIPHASDVVLGGGGTGSVGAEEGRSVFGRESLQREHEQPGSFPLADVPFRGAADPGLDDAGTEEVVAILERNREIPRERFERRTFLGRGARRNRGGRRRTAGGARDRKRGVRGRGEISGGAGSLKKKREKIES